MRAFVTVLAVMLSAGISSVAADADRGAVYVWVDQNGIRHYQDRPPEGQDLAAQQLDLRYKLTDPAAVAAENKRTAEKQTAAAKVEQEQAEEAASDKADKDKLLGEREQGCATARERLEKYATAQRLYRPGPRGQRIYLTSEEIDAARADARRTVSEWCDE